jgi:lysophospholipase L1-like esterase
LSAHAQNFRLHPASGEPQMILSSNALFLRRGLLAVALAVASLSASSASAGPVRIQLFGDSTQWGYDDKTDQPVAEPPVRVLQAAMDARFGAGAVIVTERAVPGTTSGQLLAGTDGRNRPWPREVDADIVVVNHALNDSNEHVPLATYERQIAALRPTVFETPNAITVDWPAAPYVAAMRRVAARQHAPLADVDAWMRARPNWKSLLSQDGLHPTQAGYREIVLKVLMPTLEPLVKKARDSRR